MRNRILVPAAVLAFLSAAVIMGMLASSPGPAAPASHTPPPLPQPVIELVPCATEDSSNCYWDAEVQGNGTGQSFVDLDGQLYLPAS